MNKLYIFAGLFVASAVSSCCGESKCDGNAAECEKGCDSTKVCEATTCSPEERAGIEKALNFYTEAAVKGDSKIAKQGFAPAAIMSYAEGDSLVTVPIQALYEYYDQTGPHNATYEI